MPNLLQIKSVTMAYRSYKKKNFDLKYLKHLQTLNRHILPSFLVLAPKKFKKFTIEFNSQSFNALGIRGVQLFFSHILPKKQLLTHLYHQIYHKCRIDILEGPLPTPKIMPWNESSATLNFRNVELKRRPHQLLTPFLIISCPRVSVS